MEEMKMNKKFLSLILALALSASLTACGSSGTTETADDADSGDTTETVTLKVAASPTPHAEILEQVKPILAEQGIDLVITEYGDYIVPNTAVDEGDEDANYFQHTPYLEQFNAENGTDLVSVGKIHYEPMGIYAGKTASLEELPDGATIAVPNDATNEARALQLLGRPGPDRDRSRGRPQRHPQRHHQQPQEPGVHGAGCGHDPQHH